MDSATLFAAHSSYVPLYKAVDPKTGTSCLAPMLAFDEPERNYSLTEALAAVLCGDADGIGDASGTVTLARERCQCLANLLPLHYEQNIPVELRSRKQWVIWRKVWSDEKQKFTKPPLSPVDGSRIRAIGKYEDHFVTFPEALDAAIRLEAEGVGYVFTESDPYVGLDFDDCINAEGKLDSTVETWLTWFASAYREVSPSGTGIHVLCRADIVKAQPATPLPNAAEGVTLEAYKQSRYFTVTGNIIGKPITDIADCQSSVDKLLQFLPKDTQAASSSAPSNQKPLSPSEVRRMYKDSLDNLRAATKGNGNARLNNTALIAARVWASRVLEKTEEEFKREILQVVLKEWTDPHPAHGARSTVESGWKKGASEGAYNVRSYVVAVASGQYCAEAPKESPYIVSGMIYEGTANQLMGPIKEGKTTWLFTMIRNTLTGQDFIGQKTRPTNILYVTEQPRASFQAQLTRSGLDRAKLLEKREAELYILDLGHLWNLNWEGRAETIRENAHKLNAGLVIIDTFPRIALIKEIQNAGEMNESYEQIAPLTVADNRTLLMCWHERKAGGSISEAAAGTAAAGGAVDMLLRLRRVQGRSDSALNSRTRQLELCGRLPVAFEEATAIVLNNDMSNYVSQGTKAGAVKRSTEEQILSLLPQDPPGMTRDDVLAALSDEAETRGIAAPSDSSVFRALNQLVKEGMAVRTGEGKRGYGAEKGDPFRFHQRESPFG